ncbi:MAG: hypothetical protein PHE54_02675 [Bacilli bacterium]|nr:hypothetical protein [Bacilli bacterium]
MDEGKIIDATKQSLITAKEHYLEKDVIYEKELKKLYNVIFIKIINILIGRTNQTLLKYKRLEILIALLDSLCQHNDFILIKDKLKKMSEDAKDEIAILKQLTDHLRLSVKLNNYKELYNVFDLLICFTNLSEMRYKRYVKINTWIDCLIKGIYFLPNDNNQCEYSMLQMKIRYKFYSLS